MTLETSKTLGGVGALLLVIGFLGFFGTGYAGLLVFVGMILMLIGMKGLSDYYKEGGIFNNALYGFVLSIVGGVAFVATLVILVLQLIAGGFDWSNPTAWQARFTDISTIWSFIGTLIAALVVLFIFVVIAAIFYRKSLSMLAAKSGVGLFNTAGLLLLIGAILTIILVGLILIWVAAILVTVGFFSIKAEAPQPPPAPPSPA